MLCHSKSKHKTSPPSQQHHGKHHQTPIQIARENQKLQRNKTEKKQRVD
jgi:hypothetical protein